MWHVNKHTQAGRQTHCVHALAAQRPPGVPLQAAKLLKLGCGCLLRFFLGERWGPAGWVGAALIIGSSIVAQKYGMDSEKEHAA